MKSWYGWIISIIGLSLTCISLQAQEYGNGFWAAQWSPDGNLLAVADTHGSIFIFDKSGETIMTLPGHPLRALAVVWSPDQKFLASGGTDSSIRIWDVATGELVHEIKWFSEMTHRLSWNPVNNQLAAAGFSNFQAWDAVT